jgi:hypothetical protein
LNQCKATVIAHSKSAVTGKEIITFELEFPRIILAEFNTHNALSKNASSSRAIPVPTMLKQVTENPAFPVRFGAANSGMQDKGTHDALVAYEWFTDADEVSADEAWHRAAWYAAQWAEAFHKAGYAKQICNRLIEPFQMMKVVMTATELNNFYWLRDHDAADPTIAQLARVIKVAHNASEPTVLQPGEWHVPYYNSGYWKPAHQLVTSIDDFTPSNVFVDVFGHSLDHALVISASCCAQVSYRKLDDTIEKARAVVARLNLKGEEPDQPVHASPLEHQATPIAERQIEVVNDYGDGDRFYFGQNVNQIDPSTWQEGITHMDRDGQFGSGNLKGFIQHRQLVSNHVKVG